MVLYKKIINISIKIILVIFILFKLIACNNPFAPKLSSDENNKLIIKDQKTIDGVFDNFRYAYIFKDTIVYGNLLADDFTFIYRNYDLGTDVSWGRDQDMLTTNGLFQATQSLDLVWNEVVMSVSDSLITDISRSFSLSIVFNPNDIVNIQGRVNLRLIKDSTTEKWKILRWRDESDFK
jgi:hypothetical protein